MSTAHRSWYTGDATANTWVQDFSPLVMAPPLPGGDIALWPIVGKLADGREPTKFEWIEEPLTQIHLSADDELTTTETDMTFAAGEIAASGLRAGALLKDITDRTKKEIILVVTVDSTTAATVTRDYGGFVSGSGGGTTGETHVEHADYEIVGYLNFEGSSLASATYDKFASRDRSPKYNYYSLLDDAPVSVSASDLVREYRGSSPDNWGYQLTGIQQRFQRMFERTLIDSPQKARAAGVQGSMGGLRWYATQTSGSQYVTTSETFSYEVWDDGMKYLYGQGGLDGSADIICIMPPGGVQYAAYIHESAQRGEYISETVRGLRCTTLMSTITGDRVPIVPALNMPSDSFMLLNLNAVRVHFLEGRALNLYNKDIGENLDDYRQARLISEVTLEFHRPTDNCYYHTGVTYTRPS